MRFVDRFRALLFDMNGTFMFGHDRLSEEEDFFATYRRLGGTRLTPPEVRKHVRESCVFLQRIYDDPARVDSFPPLLDAVQARTGLDRADAGEIAEVIGDHEVGAVPRWAAEALRALATTHPLALVTNVWAPAPRWSPPLAAAGLTDLFRARVFSSDLGCIKPSPRLFHAALRELGVRPSDTLFIGDSLERDIRPAQALGMAAVLVGEPGASREADLIVRSIADLPDALG